MTVASLHFRSVFEEKLDKGFERLVDFNIPKLCGIVDLGCTLFNYRATEISSSCSNCLIGAFIGI